MEVIKRRRKKGEKKRNRKAQKRRLKKKKKRGRKYLIVLLHCSKTGIIIATIGALFTKADTIATGTIMRSCA
jgi:hypothetical protein